MSSANTPPSTIAEAEALIQAGLERLRDAPLNEVITSALAFLAPKGYRVVAQMEEEGRKKRSTASISNWNHATGEIVLFFEPVNAEAAAAQTKTLTIPTAAAPAADAPNTDASSAAAAAGSVARGPIMNAIPALSVTPAALPTAVVKISAQDEVRECCEALAEAEKLGRPFYAIKWFRDIFLPERELSWVTSIQDRQRVLNRTIQSGYIETRSIPNPNNAAFPTTTLQLNREKAATLTGSRISATELKEQLAAPEVSSEEIVVR